MDAESIGSTSDPLSQCPDRVDRRSGFNNIGYMECIKKSGGSIQWNSQYRWKFQTKLQCKTPNIRLLKKKNLVNPLHRIIAYARNIQTVNKKNICNIKQKSERKNRMSIRRRKIQENPGAKYSVQTQRERKLS